MKDRPIQVGDLVYVAKPTPCCGAERRVGEVFRVNRIRKGDHPRCALCDTPRDANTLFSETPWGICQVNRLKRIPPLDELEGQRTEEDIKEPA